MAKFDFRLQRYLDVKEQLENQKKLEYAQANLDYENAKNKKLILLEELDNQVKSFRQNIENQVLVKNISQYNDYIEILKKDIIKQEQVIHQKKKVVDIKKLELLRINKETKIITKLKENKYEEFLQEEKLLEEKYIDEIVSYKYNKK